MQIYAQHGYGEGDKIIKGIKKKLVNGVIFSPRDITHDKLMERITELKIIDRTSELLFDPQYYACLLGSNPRLNIGKLVDYQSHYFNFQLRRELEKESTISDILKRSINYQDKIGVDSIIAPNIMISNSFDSIDALIAKNFLRLAKNSYKKTGQKKPLLCTLAISNIALNNLSYLQEFLNEITLLEQPPEGFYVVIGVRNSDARSELLNSDLLASWMLINYSLKVNGFKVLNGYSDTISPLLSSVGGDVGCTGWWSNLRSFSLDKFTPISGGGRLPLQRYLSKALLNRITFYELEALKKPIPEILNDLKTDKIYESSEPERALEVLQTWEALKSVCAKLSDKNILNNLKSLDDMLKHAGSVYSQIDKILRLDAKSNQDHIEPFRFAIKRFRKLAEL